MRLLVCAMLVGGALAHYYRSYEDHVINPMVVRTIEDHYVACPVCDIDRDQFDTDECFYEGRVTTIGGNHYKQCLYGRYFNEKCGKLDCYRGAGENCTEHMNYDKLGKRCRPGYTCDMGRCRAPGSPNDIQTLTTLYQDQNGKLGKRHQSPFDWNDYIRARRQA